MADGFIQVAPDSTGKLMQTYINVIGGNTVHAEAVVLVDSNGAPITTLPVSGPITNAQLRASPVSVDGSGAIQPVSGTVTAQQNNAANFNATVASITNPVTVAQSNAANLAVTANQGGTWNIGTITTFPANSSFNLSQIVGTTADTNSGNKSAGTLRVVLATDQPNVPIVNPVGGTINTNEVPDATSAFAPSNSSSSAYESSRLVKSSAGVLFAITGYNSSGSDQFIQLHNANSVPADTAVPEVIFIVRAGRNFSLTFGKFGRYFSTGIVICNSSTGPTKTIGNNDCWFDAQYK